MWTHTSLLPAWVAAVLGSANLGAALLASGPWREMSGIVGIGMMALALFVFRRRRGPPVFVKRSGRPNGGEGLREDIFGWAGGVLAMLALGALGVFFRGASSTDAAVGGLAVLAARLVPAVLAGSMAWTDRDAVRLLWRLWRGPTVEGRLVEGGFERRRVFRFTESSRTEHVVGVQGRVDRRETGGAHHDFEDRMTASEVLLLDTGFGSARVSTRGAWLASASEEQKAIEDAGTGHRTANSASSSRQVFARIARAVPGDRILAMGVDEDGELSGVEAVFAVPEGRAPRSRIAAELFMQAAVVGGLLALAAAGFLVPTLG